MKCRTCDGDRLVPLAQRFLWLRRLLRLSISPWNWTGPRLQPPVPDAPYTDWKQVGVWRWFQCRKLTCEQIQLVETAQ